MHIGPGPYHKTGSLLVVAAGDADKIAILSKVFDADAAPITYPPARVQGAAGTSITISPPVFFRLELIAKRNRFIVKVNNKTVTDYLDTSATHAYVKGRIALMTHSADSVSFKKMAIKKLTRD